jgi:hypothetical protein
MIMYNRRLKPGTKIKFNPTDTTLMTDRGNKLEFIPPRGYIGIVKLDTRGFLLLENWFAGVSSMLNEARENHLFKMDFELP